VLGVVSPASVGLRLPFEQGDPRGNARTGGGIAGTACLVVGSSGRLELGRVEGGRRVMMACCRASSSASCSAVSRHVCR
jgi:hypothetical protein